MMGTPGEGETRRFITDHLHGLGLAPHTEDIQWSNAYVTARKALVSTLIPLQLVYYLALRIGGTAGGVLSILAPILGSLFVVILGKAVLDDRFSYLGPMSTGKNVICDLPPDGGKPHQRMIYLTAHTDSVASTMPRLGTRLIVLAVLFFLASTVITLVGGVFQLTGSGPGLYPLIVLELMVVDSLVIVISLFEKRVNTSPGAVDNGSGVAILLSLAEHFKQDPLRKSSLKFIFFAGEEWGLYGSKGYVRAHREELLERLEQDVLINVDMVGSELAFVEKAGPFFRKPLNKELNGLISETADQLGIEARAYSTPLGNNSDHAPFRKLKMETAFFLAKKDIKRIHSPQDTIDGVDPDKLDEAVSLLKAVVLELDRR